MLSYSLLLTAGRSDKGIKQLSRENYDKAEGIFKEALSEDSNDIVAQYGLAVIYARENSNTFKPEKAYQHISEVLTTDNNTALGELGITKANIIFIQDKLVRYFYTKATVENTIEGYKEFLFKYSNTKYTEPIKSKLYVKALGLARQAKSIDAYNEYIEAYPESNKFLEEAIAERNKLAFEQARQANTTVAFDSFLVAYPNAVEKDEIMALRNEKAYLELLESKNELQNVKLNQKQLELEKQVSERNTLIVGLVMVLLLSIISIIGFLQTRKAKNEIAQQKKLVDIKNAKITDSIKYAKYIQDAILPSHKLVKEYIAESFILYKPKDIVSGDFYWMENINQKTIFAAVDCTGHGVPGAIMSMVGHNGLNKAVHGHNFIKPSDILDSLNKTVNDTLSRNHNENQVKDGMDIALCMLDLKNMKLQYSGAHNPLFFVRNNELTVIKADKHPIGSYLNGELKRFKNHEIELQRGDSFYIFSDGYPDQFGGTPKKKYMIKNFKKLLLSINDKHMEEQRELLDQEFMNWKGEINQTDDVCVIGVRV